MNDCMRREGRKEAAVMTLVTELILSVIYFINNRMLKKGRKLARDYIKQCLAPH